MSVQSDRLTECPPSREGWASEASCCSPQEGRPGDICTPLPCWWGGGRGGWRENLSLNLLRATELPGSHGGGSEAGPLGSILWGQTWQAQLDPKSKAGAEIQWPGHSVTGIPAGKMSKPLLRTVPTPLPASGGSSRARPCR